MRKKIKIPKVPTDELKPLDPEPLPEKTKGKIRKNIKGAASIVNSIFGK